MIKQFEERKDEVKYQLICDVCLEETEHGDFTDFDPAWRVKGFWAANSYIFWATLCCDQCEARFINIIGGPMQVTGEVARPISYMGLADLLVEVAPINHRVNWYRSIIEHHSND
jgi:hypothetical protein